MTLLYFGSEMDAAIGSDSSVKESTTSNTYDSTYSRCSVICSGTAPYFTPVSFAALNKGWFHAAHAYRPLNNTQRTVLSWRDASEQELFALSCQGFTPDLSSQRWKMFFYNGSGYTQIGSTIDTNQSVQNIDVHLDQDQGLAALYIGDSLQTSGTATMSLLTGITHVRHQAADPGGASHWSQWIADTTSTVGRRLQTVVEDTNGAVQQWTGLVTNINELVFDDAAGITSSSAGDVSTYYKNGQSFTGLNILGIGTSARFSSASGPTGIQNALRVSSTNYFGATVTGSASFAVNQNMWATNPNTGQAWTPNTAAGIEWGVKSIA